MLRQSLRAGLVVLYALQLSLLAPVHLIGSAAPAAGEAPCVDPVWTEEGSSGHHAQPPEEPCEDPEHDHLPRPAHHEGTCVVCASLGPLLVSHAPVVADESRPAATLRAGEPAPGTGVARPLPSPRAPPSV